MPFTANKDSKRKEESQKNSCLIGSAL